MQADIVNLTEFLASPTTSVVPRVIDTSLADAFDHYIEQSASPSHTTYAGIDTSLVELAELAGLSSQLTKEDDESMLLDQIEHLVGSGTENVPPMLESVMTSQPSQTVTLQLVLEQPIEPSPDVAPEYLEVQPAEADAPPMNAHKSTDAPKTIEDRDDRIVEPRAATPDTLVSASRLKAIFNQNSGAVSTGGVTSASDIPPNATTGAGVIAENARPSLGQSPVIEVKQGVNNAGTSKDEIDGEFVSATSRLSYTRRFREGDIQARDMPSSSVEKELSRKSTSEKKLLTTDSAAKITREIKFSNDGPEADFNPTAIQEVDLSSISPSSNRTFAPHSNQIASPHHVPRIANQIVSHFQQKAGDLTSLELSPDELGILRFNISHGERISIQVVVERPETLELIRRHIDLFQKELHDMGLGSSEFTFTDNRQQPNAQHPENDSNMVFLDDNTIPSVNEPALRARIIASDRLDIRF